MQIYFVCNLSIKTLFVHFFPFQGEKEKKPSWFSLFPSVVHVCSNRFLDVIHGQTLWIIHAVFERTEINFESKPECLCAGAAVSQIKHSILI